MNVTRPFKESCTSATPSVMIARKLYDAVPTAIGSGGFVTCRADDGKRIVTLEEQKLCGFGGVVLEDCAVSSFDSGDKYREETFAETAFFETGPAQRDDPVIAKDETDLGNEPGDCAGLLGWLCTRWCYRKRAHENCQESCE